MPALSIAPAGHPSHLALSGRLLAFTYDERGRCDGFVLELRDGRERCFATREPALVKVLGRAFLDDTPMTIIAAPGAPDRPLAVIPVET